MSVGFIVNIKGERSHDVIAKGIQILLNLTHRGACGCDPNTGDGAGLIIQIPHEFLARECAKLGFTLPARGEYGAGCVFLPVEPQHRLLCEGIVERIIREEGLTLLGWRDMPVDVDAIGRVARASQPYIEQVFVNGDLLIENGFREGVQPDKERKPVSEVLKAARKAVGEDVAAEQE